MRKRSITHVAKTVFWYALYFLPVLAYLIFLFTNPIPEKSDTQGIITSDPYEVYQRVSVKNTTIHYNDFDQYLVGDVKGINGVLKLTVREVGSTTRYTKAMPVVFILQGAPTGQFFANNYYMTINSNYNLAYTFNFNLPVGYELDTTSNISLGFYSDPGVISSYVALGGIKPEDITIETLYSANSIHDTVYDFSFEEFVESMGFEFATENFIVTTLEDMFGAQGVMPLFNDTAPFIIFGWYICVFIVHLMVDFLMFIPKFAHKWMEDFVGD